MNIDGPDRKGRREIMFTARPNKRGGGFTLWVNEDRWPGVEPFLREVGTAPA
jgi:hypothetical protein